jgi:succinate dehydrogenase hydrophobic anchor subunit
MRLASTATVNPDKQHEELFLFVVCLLSSHEHTAEMSNGITQFAKATAAPALLVLVVVLLAHAQQSSAAVPTIYVSTHGTRRLLPHTRLEIER